MPRLPLGQGCVPGDLILQLLKHAVAAQPAAQSTAHATAARLPYPQQHLQKPLHGRQGELGVPGGRAGGVCSSWLASQRADSASGQGSLNEQQVKKTALVP